jgi:hypothetical protein
MHPPYSFLCGERHFSQIEYGICRIRTMHKIAASIPTPTRGLPSHPILHVHISDAYTVYPSSDSIRNYIYSYNIQFQATESRFGACSHRQSNKLNPRMVLSSVFDSRKARALVHVVFIDRKVPQGIKTRSGSRLPFHMHARAR